jgi:Domain of unknown function (DUF1707)
MEEDRQKMRASDSDREEVVDRLRAGLDDGRLKMEEFLERIGVAYEAVTYSDLAVLFADLPTAGSMAKREVAPQELAPVDKADHAVAARRGLLAELPVALKVLWTIWLTAVSINVVVWVLVSVTSGQLIYPWPLWVAGPSGAALFAVSAGVSQIQRSRRSAAQRRPARKGGKG